MKRIFFSLFALTLISISAFAQESLAQRIAQNERFIAINNLFDTALQMPNSGSFIEMFDKNRIAEEGNEFLSEISGIPVQDVSQLNQELISNTDGFLSEFPEVKDLSKDELELLMLQATDILYSNQQQRGSSTACNSCKRVGRANMAAGIILGAGTGSVFGHFGTWAGAVVGFWAAAENTLACLQANNC